MPKSDKPNEKKLKIASVKAKFVISGCSSENSSEYVTLVTRCLSLFKNNSEINFDYSISINPYD